MLIQYFALSGLEMMTVRFQGLAPLAIELSPFRAFTHYISLMLSRTWRQ